jgi:hypothetical protein
MKNATQNAAKQVRIAALNFARAIFQYDNNISWSNCMKLGWARAKVLAAINAANGAKLTFNTAKGVTVTRSAVSLTAGGYQAKGTGSNGSPLNVVYFDTTDGVNDVRSLRLDRLVKIAQ